jgi:hypothetical protein
MQTKPLNCWHKINALNELNPQGSLVCHRKQHLPTILNQQLGTFLEKTSKYNMDSVT